MGSLELADMPQDMTKDEKESVQDFIANGCPGLLRVQQSDIFKWFELYMAGKTYAEIATITKSKKDLIMYLAYKSAWMDKRLNHYSDISLNILDKIKQSRLDSANKLVTVIAALGKYCEQEYNRYLSTNDRSIIENLDTKIVAQYFKAQEQLDKIASAEEGGKDKPPQSPLVNINMGSSATIKEVGEKTLEITDKTAGDLLKSLASLKKAQEDKK
jgi:hypothetical protein